MNKINRKFPVVKFYSREDKQIHSVELCGAQSALEYIVDILNRGDTLNEVYC